MSNKCERLCTELSIRIKTSPRGFLASKCNVGNWIFQNLRIFLESFWNFFKSIFFEGCFLRDFLGGLLRRNFVQDIFGRISLEELFGRNFLEGILCLHC